MGWFVDDVVRFWGIWMFDVIRVLRWLIRFVIFFIFCNNEIWCNFFVDFYDVLRVLDLKKLV